jgi:glycogen operon protein
VRFAVVSRNAKRVWLALFEKVEDLEPYAEIEYNPMQHRTGDIWSMFVEGVSSGCLYMYRMEGPFKPEKGHRFDASRYLLDPYARIIVGSTEDGTIKCMAVDDKPDWVDDTRPRVKLEDLVIYETHVRGFTRHESSGVEHPGTYLGVIDKIPYLQELGVKAIELLPLQEFGETRVGIRHAITGDEIRSYWGYDSIGFFAPCGRYGSRGGLGEQLDDFRHMVTKLHEARIEVILDVVFNHTSERGADGPTLCFRGLDNIIYYMLDEQGNYRNFSGCGNTLNCNHPLVRDFILDCLRYWATVMHVDGFRFDLASILGRDTKGHIVENAGLIERIAEEPALRDAKLIAEAWDAAGAYQVGSFGDVRWAEWNGRYRDDVRRFWKGDNDMKGAFATRFAGSADLYQWAGRTPGHSINFITAHDGFTLRDLVSYNEKHNEANGEDNRDGSNDNQSWNCGFEGETDDLAINALRMRMQKNFIATLFLSLGIPMLLGGDEFGRTQGGNNNPYCQDNEISWFDWALLERNKDLFAFTKGLIAFRRENPALRRLSFFDGRPVGQDGRPDLEWFNERGGQMDWNDSSQLLACRIDGEVNNGACLYLMFNPTLSRAVFETPEGAWKVRINTGSVTHIGVQESDAAPSLDRPAGMILDKTNVSITAELSCVVLWHGLHPDSKRV